MRTVYKEIASELLSNLKRNWRWWLFGFALGIPAFLLLKAAINYILLVAGYTLAWFLGTALVFILYARKGSSMTLSLAFVLGVFTTILHLIVCHFVTNPCLLPR